MKKALGYIMDIGESMLLYGAEVARVEDSITRMGTALGFERIDVFIIPSCMIVNGFDEENKSYTQTRRIKNIGIDVDKLHLLNELSRKICAVDMTQEEIYKEYQKIKCGKRYPFYLRILFSALICGSFTLFFGGSFNDAAVSFVVGGISGACNELFAKSGFNQIFAKFGCVTVSTALALLAMKLGMIKTIDSVIIGNIMPLIPGIGLTNALRDLFVGDSISGILRLVEAALTAIAISAGYFITAAFFGGI